jgi:hypothetical protein
VDSAQFLIEIETQMKGGANAVTELGKLEQKMKQTSGVTDFFANTSIFSLRRAIDHLGGPVGKVLGPIFRFGEGLHKMAKQGGGVALMAGASLIAAGAVAGLTAKFVEGAAAALKYGLATADAARDQALTLQAMVGSEAAGDALADSFVDIEKKTGASSERLMSLTDELADAHLSSTDLATALGAIGEQEQAIGSSKTKLLIDQLKGGQVTANAMADTIDKKFGGIVKDKMMGLTQQAGVFKTEIGQLFGGLKIDGFLGALQHMIGLLDENTSSGKALKFLFESVFQPLVDAATTAMPYIELAVLRFINTLLRLYIMAKPAVERVEKLFNIKPGDGIEVALKVGEFAAIMFAVALGGVIVAIGAVVAVGYLIVVVFEAISDAIGAAVDWVKAIPKHFHQAVNGAKGAISSIPDMVSGAIDAAIAFVKNLPEAFADAIVAAVNVVDENVKAIPDEIDAVVSTVSGIVAAIPGYFEDAATGIGNAFSQIPDLLGDAISFVEGLPGKFAAIADDIIDGLVNGIKAGAGRVVDAVTNLGNDAIAAMRKAVGSHSPSTEFYDIGTDDGEGLALGHEDSAPRIKSSLDGMMELPSSSPMRAKAGGGAQIKMYFNISGPNAKENAKEVRREIEDLFEEAVIEVGGGLEAAD